MATRNIAAFFQDEEQHWVARLGCGHTLHMRHRPPFESRPWITTEQGRAAQLETEVDCSFCDMPLIPAQVQAYKRTDLFTEESLPQGLTKDHRTKVGVWGRIVVESGRLLYEIPEQGRAWVLRPGVVGSIAPQQPHHVRLVGPVQFYIEFLH